MEYDEKLFKKKANIKAMATWIVLCIVLSIAYAIEVKKGLREGSYFILLLFVLWIPVAIGFATFAWKGYHTDLFKHIISVGYGGSYSFILLTSPNVMTFVYILPLCATLVLFKDRGFVIRTGVVNMAVIIATTIDRYNKGFNSPSDFSNYEILIICTLLCYVAYYISIGHLMESDGAMLNSVKTNLSRVVETVKKVKTASNVIVDEVVVIR